MCDSEDEPVGSVALHRLERVDQPAENSRQSFICVAPCGERADGHRDCPSVGLDLDGDVVVSACGEQAQHGELEVVHPFVGKIEPAADAGEHESRDSLETGGRRDRKEDRVRHQSRVRLAPSPTLACVATGGDVGITTEALAAGGAVVRVDGELDMATTHRLEDAVEKADQGGRLVIDLTACTFLDSSAVRVLVSTARAAQAAGGSFSLVASDSGIVRVLEIAAVDTILPVHSTLDAAL